MICETPPEQTTYRILIIDDNEAIHADFRKTLLPRESDAELDDLEAAIFGEAVTPAPTQRCSFVIDSATQGEDGFAMATRARDAGEPYALAFVDMRMPPGWDGLRTIEALWACDPDLQVVICSAYSDYSWEQVIERLGVSDQLVILKKPFDTAEVSQLALALTQKWSSNRQARMKMEEMEQLVAQRTLELQHAATHDALTQLANREHLMQRMKDAVSAAESTGSDLATFFIDFDRFKIINDSLGHEAGDQLLKQIAGRLQNTLKDFLIASSDNDPTRALCARVGGDEFVLLLDRLTDPGEATRLRDALLPAMRLPYMLNEHKVYSTPSIGLTTRAYSLGDADSVLRDADLAMYAAKNSGRDCCVVFDRSMYQQSVERLELEHDLRKAVEHQEIEPFFQPIVCCESGRITGFEALARWKHAERGWVGPGLFVPVAEETGLIGAIGESMLRQAATCFVRWQQTMPYPPESISVNLSKRQVMQPGIVDRLGAIIQETGIEPGCLVLEITESIVMEQLSVFVPVLKDIKSLGVRLAMDDFGTGTSSLTSLHSFPIDVLKMDRAFIMNLDQGATFTAVVQAVITLAENLGLKVTAEGIETPEQLVQIQALDCHYGQGYYFSAPLSAEGATRLLEEPPRFAAVNPAA